MNTFQKEERLCSQRLLSLLYHKGSSFLLYPFRVSYLQVEQAHSFPAQIVINVAKKRFRHATDRNLIKRRCRETYRLNKNQKLYPFLPQEGRLLLFGLQYVGKEIHDYSFLDKRMQQVLKKMLAQINESENH